MKEKLPPEQERMMAAVRRHAEREREAKQPQSALAHLGRVGALGWQIVIPALIGLAIGRWLDHREASGIFWTLPLLLIGLGLGCWSAWRTVQR